MSRMRLPVLTWFQGYNSPQLDFIGGLTRYDADFEHVLCRYYCDRFVYSLRGLKHTRLRDLLIRVFASLPGRGDYMDVTPYVVHFGWLQHKQPFFEFAERTFAELTSGQEIEAGDGLSENTSQVPARLAARL